MSASAFVIALLCVSVAMSAIMTGAWRVWRRAGNSGWVDTVWTFGMGGVGLAGAAAASYAQGYVSARAALVAILIVIWAMRLGLHIAQRTRGITDDPRYAQLIKAWGADATRQMFWLLQKQALVSVPLTLSMVLAAWDPLPGLRPQDLVGAAVLVVAILGEATADRQLRAFGTDPANKNGVCDIGLWRYSRHPNYFFEWLGWIAYPLLAIDFAGANPWGWAALAGPLCMYWLLVHVSGIPPLEAHMLERRQDRFRAYQARTNAFFPGPRKEHA